MNLTDQQKRLMGLDTLRPFGTPVSYESEKIDMINVIEKQDKEIQRLLKVLHEKGDTMKTVRAELRGLTDRLNKYM